MPNDKVVDFNSKKRKQEEAPQQEKLPQPVIDNLQKIAEKTDLLTNELDKLMLDFAETHGQPMDISIPLEALARNLGQVSADLDAQVLPEVMEQHQQIRILLSQQIDKKVQQFAATQGTPVYSQDIYIGLVYTLISYIQQHRVWGQMKTHLQSEQGEENE